MKPKRPNLRWKHNTGYYDHGGQPRHWERLGTAEADAARLRAVDAAEWRCFHCNEIFGDQIKAEEHFGRYEPSTPACRIDIAEYRRMERTLATWQAEDTDLHREIGRLNARLPVAAREAEEEGYAKGLHDGRIPPPASAPGRETE